MVQKNPNLSRNRDSGELNCQSRDYLPIASTLTNAMMMIHKTLSEKPHEPQALSSHTFRPLVRQSGSCWRNIVLLLPFLGNFVVAIYDAYSKYRGNQLLGRTHNPVETQDVEILRSAASYGNFEAMSRLVDFAKLRPNVFQQQELTAWKQALLHQEEPSYDEEKGRFGSPNLSPSQNLADDPQKIKELINQCLDNTPPDPEETLLGLSNSLASSYHPDAVELLGTILLRGNQAEREAAAKCIVANVISTSAKSHHELVERAVGVCSQNRLEDPEVRALLIRLFKTEPYDTMKTAFDLLSTMSQRFGDKEAFSALGERYLKGPEKNDPLAFDKAIVNLQAGSNFYLLGLAYQNHLQKDHDKLAFNAFLEGAKRGDERCKVYLADCLIEGWGVARDIKEGQRILDSLKGTPTELQYESKIEWLREKLSGSQR